MAEEVQFETEHLEQIQKLASIRLSDLKDSVLKEHGDILSQKKDTWGEITHSAPANLWSPDDFEALVELSQCNPGCRANFPL